MKWGRAGVRLYAIAVALAIVWAWWVDVTRMHSHREHLAPDLLLAFLGLPASMSTSAVVDLWPGTFEAHPHALLAWLTLCGATQVAAVLWFERVLARRITAGDVGS